LTEKEIKIELVPGGWISSPIEAKMTGTWRTLRPIVDEEKCVGCGLCEMYCPEASVKIVNRKAVIDYDYCKGCGVCANECPQDAIQMSSEIQARGEK
jgi:pyruvate ferredoxin oxidoreductase delta subunit